MAEKNMQVLLQVLVSRGNIYACHLQTSKVEEYAYRPQLLTSVYVKMKSFKLTRMIKEVLSVMDFQSEGGRKYASITTQNDIEVPDAARQVK